MPHSMAVRVTSGRKIIGSPTVSCNSTAPQDMRERTLVGLYFPLVFLACPSCQLIILVWDKTQFVVEEATYWVSELWHPLILTWIESIIIHYTCSDMMKMFYSPEKMIQLGLRDESSYRTWSAFNPTKIYFAYLIGQTTVLAHISRSKCTPFLLTFV